MAVVYNPTLVGRAIVASKQQAPVMRMRVNKAMKYQLELLRSPCRKVSRIARNKQGM
jgi:hypothetical protein